MGMNKFTKLTCCIAVTLEQSGQELIWQVKVLTGALGQ